MWKNNFQRLYSSVDGTGDKHVYYDRMKLVEWQSNIVFTMSDIFSAVNQQKKGKSTGQMDSKWRHSFMEVLALVYT